MLFLLLFIIGIGCYLLYLGAYVLFFGFGVRYLSCGREKLWPFATISALYGVVATLLIWLGISTLPFAVNFTGVF